MTRQAIIDPTGSYRYSLTREWSPLIPLNRVLFIMLNPSTADETQDDPTIRKCVGFAQLWGFGSLEVVNLFAFRSTDPNKLPDAWDPVGPHNNQYIEEAVYRSAVVVVAWGRHRFAELRIKAVTGIVERNRKEMHCLGRNDDGSPKHPLYVPYRQKPIPYILEAA